MDAYTLPCKMYIYTEGKVKPTDVEVVEFDFTNNGLAFLFSEMRYEINDIEKQKLKYSAISSILKGCCSYNSNYLHILQNADWYADLRIEDNKYFVVNYKLTSCISLKYLFGFCGDYKKYCLIAINN